MSEFVVLVEAEADYHTATGVAGRVFNEESPEWLVDHLHDKFCWIGLEPQTSFTCWSHFKEVENRAYNQGYHRSRYLGHSKEGETQKADFAIARKVLLLTLHLKKRRDIQAVLLIRDLDNQPERRNGLEQARRDFQNDALQVVIGVADPKREAWVLNGFISQNEDEHKIYQEIRQEIGFDPCLEAQRLHGNSRRGAEQRRRDAKVVLERLTQGDYEREKSCWCNTSLKN